MFKKRFSLSPLVGIVLALLWLMPFYPFKSKTEIFSNTLG
ncbi:carbohydrate ABC transporter permease, partial [Enterococcus faecium]